MIDDSQLTLPCIILLVEHELVLNFFKELGRTMLIEEECVRPLNVIDGNLFFALSRVNDCTKKKVDNFFGNLNTSMALRLRATRLATVIS